MTDQKTRTEKMRETMKDTNLFHACALGCYHLDPSEYDAWGLYAACVAMGATTEDTGDVARLLDVPRPKRSRADVVLCYLSDDDWPKAARILVDAGVYEAAELARTRVRHNESDEYRVDLVQRIEKADDDETGKGDRTESGTRSETGRNDHGETTEAGDSLD